MERAKSDVHGTTSDAPTDAPVAEDGRHQSRGDAVWRGIDHVQVAIPVGTEELAREFWVGRLGFVEVAKPARLAIRGGAWFIAGSTVVHVGVEPEFRPARKAHPALLVAGLHDLVQRAALAATWSDEIPGSVRCHVDDPFGNRIELIEAAA